MRTIILLAGVLTLLMPVKSSAQLVGAYVSPGLQLGYTRGQGVAFSAQVTLGLFMVLPYGGMIDFLIPGITFGQRRSKDVTMTYLDAQFSLIVVGAGIGKVWIRNKGEDRVVATYPRFKAWGGWLLNVTYDQYYDQSLVPGDTAPRRHFGVIGVLPIPLIGFGGIGGSLP